MTRSRSSAPQYAPRFPQEFRRIAAGTKIARAEGGEPDRIARKISHIPGYKILQHLDLTVTNSMLM